MDRPRASRACGVAISALIAVAGLGACADDAPRPNVLLVSIDSLRADHLGAYGYARDTSPTLDALARRGVLFEDTVSTTSWTLPAHAALFTGLYDTGHGVVDNGQRLAERHVTLAEHFSAAGYETVGLYAGPYLHPAFGLAQGFESYSSCMAKLDEKSSEFSTQRLHRKTHRAAQGGLTGPCVAERVHTWLDKREAEADSRPWFLFLHLWDPHYDYVPPADYAALFDPDYTGELDGSGFMQDPRIHASMPARDLAHLVALYDAEIRFTDDILGKILATLGIPPSANTSADGERTIVVVSADHGDEFFEHGRKGHQKTLYEEVVRVPLVIVAPQHARALEKARRVAQQVRLIDIAPTLLALTGLDANVAVHGRDLSPLLRGDSLPPATALLELRADRRDMRALRSGREGAGLESGREGSGRHWKLIAAARGTERFHDLEVDPQERQPAPRGDARIEPARRALEATLAHALGAAAPAGQIDAELEQRLEALGYLEPTEVLDAARAGDNGSP